MPASSLQVLRPSQVCSVLFAYDNKSKVLYEYMANDAKCTVLWTPQAPAENAAIWAVLPLPPAWLLGSSTCIFKPPGCYTFTLPAGSLSSIRPGHTDLALFS